MKQLVEVAFIKEMRFVKLDSGENRGKMFAGSLKREIAFFSNIRKQFYPLATCKRGTVTAIVDREAGVEARGWIRTCRPIVPQEVDVMDVPDMMLAS